MIMTESYASFFRTPGWDDFVNLAITEIRQYGKDSLQVVRRLRSMLENLIDIVPPQRAVSLKAELEVLNRSVLQDFREPEDQARATLSDSLGMG